MFPGGGHGIGESRYAARKRMDFFVRHLPGGDPRAKLGFDLSMLQFSA